MAIPGPVGKENMLISFRLHSKTYIFDGSTNALNNAKLNIVASSNNYGLVFVGSTNAEILVICTKDLELPTAINQDAPVRKIPMPSQINQLATNCDGSMLAVDTKINGVPHIQLYSVPSFLSPNVQKIREFRVSADNASSIQLCWNPVLNTVLAVCTESGGLNLYVFKDQGVNFFAIDPSLKAKSCCWSPKGKQIVAGFCNGKLIQFNIELKPARTIECPPGIFQGGNFDVITVQWLSTYQFAVAFLSHQEGSRPILHILNAPKTGTPQYISYNDVCYSTSEIRPSKIYIQYIQAWGMLLVASANCVDVSLLKISKPADIPEWTQEFPNDQFLAELPLTPKKDESFPVGFELETACLNKLIQEDGNPYPVMPMIHIVSTYGIMCSFYVVNTTQSYVDICSPPRPIDPRIQSLFVVYNNPSDATKTATDESIFKTPLKNDPAPISHSTPSIPKQNIFGASPATATPFNLTNIPAQGQTNTFSGFSLGQNMQAKPIAQPPVSTGFSVLSKPIATVTSTPQSFPNQPLLSTVPQNVSVPQNKTLLATPINQPLITIQPSYNPAPQSLESNKDIPVNEKLAESDDEEIYIKMIQDEIKAFELELNFLMEKSRSVKVNIGTKEESVDMRKKLEELDELKREATENIESLKSDVQSNRLGLTEMFSMVYESKAKCSLANNEKSIMMSQNQIQDRSIKRTLDKLKKMISHCEMQIHLVIQLLNSQWANYQDTLNRNKRNKMHVPSLEGVYQTLTKQQEIIYNLSAKLKLLKSKLGICDEVKKQKNSNVNATIESLSDSIISMSLIDQVQNEKSKLTGKKHKNLLNYLENREVITIKPQRPSMPGLNSEIVIEKKMKAMKQLKKSEPKKVFMPQKEIKPPAQVLSKIQPSETAYDFGPSVQRSAIFTPVTISSSQQHMNTAKKEDSSKSVGLSFGSNTSMPPSFGLSNASLNLNSSLPPTSFGSSIAFGTPSFVSSTEKKELKVQPQSVPQIQKDSKPVATISNTNVSVSANFSVPLPPKSMPQIANSVKVEEKKVEEVKPLTTNESTSFTFSLPGKKEMTAQSSNKLDSVIAFGNTPSVAVSDNVKSAFSFNAAASSFGFGASKEQSVKPVSSAASIFSGSSSVSFGFGNSSKSLPTASTNIFTSGSIPSMIPKTVEEAKPIVSSSESPSTTHSTNSGEKTTETKTTFSFASLATSVPTTTSSNVLSSLLLSKNDPEPTSEVSSSVTSSDDSVLQGLNICSPNNTTSPTLNTTSPSNIFMSALQTSAKADSSSVFGSNSFASSFGPSNAVSSTQSSIFSSPITTVSQSLTITKTTQSPSIFAQTPVSTVPSFESLDLSKKSPPQNDAPTNIFASPSPLNKPDQSVFGQSTVSAASQSTGTFSNIFAATANNNANVAPQNTSNIFGTPSSTPSSNVFGSPSQSNIFGGQPAQSNQGSIFSQTTPTTGGSIFGQVTTTTTTVSTGSIFSQSSFSSPTTGSTSIFGGSNTNTQSPFGSSSVFGSNGQKTQQTSSIFGVSSSFGTQANPNTNIFGGSPASATSQQTSSSPFGSSNIFAQAQNPTFGGSATFSNNFGQSALSGGSIFAQQQQSQPVFGGSASFGPKTNIFGSSAPPSSPPNAQTGNIFDQLGSQQQSGNLFGNLAQTSPPPIQQQQSGFSGSAFSSWR